jgi:hypothetical protein
MERQRRWVPFIKKKKKKRKTFFLVKQSKDFPQLNHESAKKHFLIVTKANSCWEHLQQKILRILEQAVGRLFERSSRTI